MQKELSRLMCVRMHAGGDGTQPFNYRQYSSLVYGLHLQDLPRHLLAKNAAWAPLGCVDGPNEPSSMMFLLADMIQFFNDHDPSGFLISCST